MMPGFVKEFEGKTVIVTGASRGIGRAISVKLDELGATVYAVSRSSERLESLRSECCRVKPVVVDLSNWKETREAIKALPVAEYLVNNAGVLSIKGFRETTEEDLDRVFGVNVKAVFNVSQIFVEKLARERGSGSIVNISSAGSTRPCKVGTAYTVSKAALDHLSRNMALDLAPLGIRVNSVRLGFVVTDMLHALDKGLTAAGVPLETMISRLPMESKSTSLEEAVNATLFLLSSQAVSTATGSSLLVDSGYVLT